jgi:hypothetical protein
MTSFLSNLAIHWKEVIYYISLHAGTAEPLRVSPPEAVDYVIDLGGRSEGKWFRGILSARLRRIAVAI